MNIYKTKFQKQFYLIIFAILISLLTSIPAFANNAVDVKPIKPLDDVEKKSTVTTSRTTNANSSRVSWDGTTNKREDGTWDVGLPDASMKDAENWVDRKGYDIISLLQKGSQSFMVILLIIGAFMTAMGGRQMRPAGMTMMLFAIVCQSLILFAPELMDFFQSWIAS